MSEWVFFSACMVFCASVVLGISVILHRRLLAVLADIFESEVRARFWVAAFEMWFIFYSITGALRCKPEGATDRDDLLSSIVQTGSGSEGMSHAVILASIGLAALILVRQVRERGLAGKEVR